QGSADSLSASKIICIVTSAIRLIISRLILCSLQSAYKYTQKIPKQVDYALGFNDYCEICAHSAIVCFVVGIVKVFFSVKNCVPGLAEAYFLAQSYKLNM
ncbi:MAG: hypothetical protein IJQ64_09260, partial [Prevotella sp.]|nr:hypothetical protein [Prevotella sp.]